MSSAGRSFKRSSSASPAASCTTFSALFRNSGDTVCPIYSSCACRWSASRERSSTLTPAPGKPLRGRTRGPVGSRHHSMIRVKYGVMPSVRTGEAVTAGSVASSICPLPKNIATLWLPLGP